METTSLPSLNFPPMKVSGLLYMPTPSLLNVSNKLENQEEDKVKLIKDDFIEVPAINDDHPSFGTEEEKSKRTMISAYTNKKFDHHHERYLHTICKLRYDIVSYIITQNKSRDNT